MSVARVAGALLAAGHSRRWGPDDKLLAPWNGKALVAHAALTLVRAPLARRAAVVRAGKVGALLPGLTLLPPAGDDLSGSLRAAAAWARAEGADKLLILLGDMPAVSDETCATLTAGCRDRPTAVRYPDGHAGVPACFPAAAIAALADLSGDQGARALLADAAVLPVAAAELVDVDVPRQPLS